MLKSQEITLAQSRRRERMAAIQKTETLSDEGRTELRSLTVPIAPRSRPRRLPRLSTRRPPAM